MATTQASDQYVEFDEFVDYHLAKTRSNIKLTDVLTAIVGIAVLVVGYLLVFTLLDHWVVDGGFGFAARAAMLALIVVVAIGWVAWRVILPWLKPVNRLYAAGVIEDAEPELKRSLFNLVDLGRSEKSIRPEVRRAMEKQAALRLSEVDVDNSVDRRTLMRFAYVLLFLVVASCLYAVFSPKKISFLRTLTLADAEVATRTEILAVEPGDVEVIAGDQVEVTVDLKGQVPESVRIYYSLADRSVVDEPVEMREVEDGIRQFRGIINGTNGRGILQEMTYHVVAGDARSDDFNITVNRPPSALVDGITLTFPDYMATAERRQSGGHIDAYEGTRVRLTASANMPVNVARLEFFDEPGQKGEQRSLKVDGTTLSVEWPLTVASDGTFLKHYRIYVENKNGDTDPNPTTYNVNIKRDKAPEVVLLDPARDVELPVNGVLPLLLQAHDPDFKLRSIALRFQRVGVEFEQSESIYDGLTDGFHKAWAGQHEFRLSGRGFEAGDVVRFWLEARDNRPPLGNRATTLPLKIHVIAPVSAQEAEKRLEEDRKQQKEVLDELRDQQPDAAADDGGADGDADQPGREPGEEQNADGDPSDDSNQNGEIGDDSGNPGSEPGDNRESGNPNRKPEDNQTGDGSKEQRSGKARDDEALQKMIERLQEQKQDDVGGNLKDDPSQEKPSDKSGSNQTEPDQTTSDKAQSDSNGKQPNENGENESRPQPGEQTAPGDGETESQPGDLSSGQKKNADDARDKPPTKSGEGDTAVNRDDPNLNKTGDASKGGESIAEDGDKAVQKQAGKGDETGEAKAGDADAKTNQANNPDDLNRRPGEEPTLRDADGKKPDGQTPAERNPATNPDQVQQSPGGEKPNGDPKPDGEQQQSNQPGESGSKQKSPSGSESKQQSGKDGESGADAKSGDPQGGKQPGEEPGKSGDESGKSGEAGGKSGESGESGGNSGESGGNSGESGGKSGESGGKSGESGGKSGESGGKSGESGGKSGESGGKSGESGGKSGESGGKSGESGGKSGESGGKSGESGGKSGESGDESGGKSGESGESGKSGGESGKSAAGGGSSSESGKGGGSEGPGGGGAASSGKANKMAGGGHGGGGADDGDRTNEAGAGDGGSGTGDPADGAPEDPNLNDAKKAANLVLDKLNEELNRGEIDEKLLKELGWDEKDLANFVERMKKQLAQQQADEEVSPKTEAQRKRFEEMLKSLDLEKGRSRRVGSSDRDRTMKGVNTRQIQAPAEYRDAFEEYKRSLSRKKK